MFSAPSTFYPSTTPPTSYEIDPKSKPTRMSLPVMPVPQLPDSPPQTPENKAFTDLESTDGGIVERLEEQAALEPPVEVGGTAAYGASQRLISVTTGRGLPLKPLDTSSLANSTQASATFANTAIHRRRSSQYEIMGIPQHMTAANGTTVDTMGNVIDLNNSPPPYAAFPVASNLTVPSPLPNNGFTFPSPPSRDNTPSPNPQTPVYLIPSRLGDSHSVEPSPPGTPKGHPIQLNSFPFGNVGNVLKDVQGGVEQGMDSVRGFLGGGGTGLARGMKGSLDEKHQQKTGSGGMSLGKYGKFYRPSKPLSNADDVRSNQTHSFRTTISYLTRVPRRARPLLFGIVVFVFLGVVMLRWAADKAAGAQVLAARKHAAHMQKAFIISEREGGLAHHPVLATYLKEQMETSKQLLEDMEELPYATESEEALTSSSTSASGGFQMNKREELVALLSFLTSTTANALLGVDPEKPLQPQMVLDFDYTKPTAREDMEQLETDMMTMFPVVLFGKMRDPRHRELMKTMSKYKITPAPLIVEVDQRSDADVLVPLLMRLLDTPELPQIVLAGKAAGGYKDIQAWAEKGTFEKVISDSGASISIPKKKKVKYIKDAARRENERILAPKPPSPLDD